MKKIIITILLCISAQYSMQSQNFFDVIEKDQDGNWRDANGNAKINYINNQITDINSILIINFETENIISSVNNRKGLPTEIAQKITSIKKVLRSQNEILERIDLIIKNLDYSKYASDPGKLNDQLSKLQGLAQQVVDLKNIDITLEDRADKISNGNIDLMFSSNYKAATEILKEEQDKLSTYAKEQGLSIKFGAWLITKRDKIPLHMDGFDNIAPQQQYEVERWAISLTADQKAELAELQQYAKENRDKGLNILNEMISLQIKAIKELAWVEYTKMADQINIEIKKLENDSRVQEIVAKARTFSADLLIFKNQAEIRANYYKNLASSREENISGLVSRVTDDINYFTTTAEKLKISALDLKSDINNVAISLSPDIMDTINLLIKTITDKIEKLKNLNNSAIKDIIEGRKLDAAALEFSDAVLKLSLSDVQKSFEYDLVNSGFREEGNRIAFKLSVFDKTSTLPIKQQVREIYLFKVLTHVISTVGIAFADPFTSTAIQTQFQMAPYYNLLFKGLIDKEQRRKSISYNKFLDWGVGLHVSAPDFDKDDVPELGVGLVITALHDYVQTGIAYNIFTGDPYWFFGLRIPTPSFAHNGQ